MENIEVKNIINSGGKPYVEIEGIDGTTYAGKAASALKTKARGIMGDDLLIFKLVDFVSIMLINNRFASNGIFVTDDNKEECYIKIIETGDETLISDLERFINIKDDIRSIEKQKEDYVSLINQLQKLTDHNDEEAVNSIVEEYLRR
jgi:hypothetical protein